MRKEDSNFRVYVRCRGGTGQGPSQPYRAASACEIVRDSAPSKQYRFDRVFDENSNQEVIFQACAEPLIDEFLRGYNGTIFAYGQTGTGKTHTITGDLAPSTESSQAGIVPRVLENVFSRLNSSNSHDWILELKYVELYNEDLRDLLNTPPPQTTARVRGTQTSSNSKQLRIVESRNHKSIEVVGAVSIPVNSLESALSLVKKAASRRQTAATQLNADSSRSHTILTLILVSREPVSGMAVRSKLHIVDLAGSENVARSGAVKLRAQEAGEINKSLLSLGRVIEMLVSTEQASETANNRSGRSAAPNAKPYVSYRESKLTHLLQDSLGGSTRTCMIATISLSSANAEESRSTLEYASRAMSIRNQTQTEVEVMEMQGTLKGLGTRMEELHQELMMQRSKDGGVYVSNTIYHQLKSSQRKYAELLAQRETAAKHYKVEIGDLQADNAALRASCEKLKSELDKAKDNNRQYEGATESSQKVKSCTEKLMNIMSRYDGEIDVVTTTVAHVLKELPSKLDSLKEQLLEAANFKIETSILDEKMDSETIEATNRMRESLTRSLRSTLENINNSLHKTIQTTVYDVSSKLDRVFEDVDAVKDLCSQLRRLFDGIQADIAMQQQTGNDVTKLIGLLASHDQMYEEAVARFANERRSLINTMMEKHEQSSIQRLSRSASGVMDLVKAIEDKGSVTSQKPALENAFSPILRELQGVMRDNTMESDIGASTESFENDIKTAYKQSMMHLNDHELHPRTEKLQGIANTIDAYCQGLLNKQMQSNSVAIDSLRGSKVDVRTALHDLHKIAEQSEADLKRIGSSSAASQSLSPLGSPQRSPQRSLQRSPQRSPQRGPQRSPQRGLLRSPTKIRPTRKLVGERIEREAPDEIPNRDPILRSPLSSLKFNGGTARNAPVLKPSIDHGSNHIPSTTELHNANKFVNSKPFRVLRPERGAVASFSSKQKVARPDNSQRQFGAPAKRFKRT